MAKRDEPWTFAEVLVGLGVTLGTAFLGGFAWHYGMKAAEWYDEKEGEAVTHGNEEADAS